MSVIVWIFLYTVFLFARPLLCIDHPGTHNATRSFAIDFQKNTFLKDGKPFRYVSAEIHYFRMLRQYWKDRLRKCRAAGINVVQIYIEWSSHEPTPRNYKFNGELDVEYFIQLAEQEGLLVILRPGPYICAERDMGGLPYWLLTLHPDIVFRTNNSAYENETKTWFQVLMPKLTKYLYGNGGPIIMVQVENEYGQYTDCNMPYKVWLRDLIKSYVGDAAVLYTLDRSVDIEKGCGLIPNVYPTVDFGVTTDPCTGLSKVRKFYKQGPLVCTEFYTGFIDVWGLPKNIVNITALVNSSVQMLDMGASLSYYMFFGGTNFGFTNGAIDYDVSGLFRTQITSYDYDAPLNEAGDPTEKYYAIRNMLSRYFVLPDIPVPQPSPKGKYGVVKLQPTLPLFNHTNPSNRDTQHSIQPRTFEQLQQQGGYVLYETKIPNNTKNGALLDVRSLRDRALIYLNYNYVGVLSRSQNIFSMLLPSPANKTLSMLVENQGRVSLGRHVKDPKGLLSAPNLDDVPLLSWNMTKLPLENLFWFQNIIPTQTDIHVPAFYRGEFVINTPTPLDTYVNPSGWGKGVIFVNGNNIGRYWPSVGSQVTLYLPSGFLLPAPRTNTIVLFETEITHPSYEITFTDQPILTKITSLPV